MSALGAQISRKAALDAVAQAFAAAGIEDARREARLLLLAALQIDLSTLVRDENAPVGEALSALQVMVVRRLQHEPLSRILGRRAFFGLDFALNEATLDPRPETEHLVEAVLDWVTAQGQSDAPLRLLDLGTGTGAILIALLSRLPNAEGLGVDLAEEAVAMARANAARLGVGERACFVQGDLFDSVSGLFDVIVSNPPYIPQADIAALMPEVRDFDPVLALDGGADGLDFYRRIAREAGAFLKPGGVLALEIGIGQGESVPALLHEYGFAAIRVFKDYAGVDRVVQANRPE